MWHKGFVQCFLQLSGRRRELLDRRSFQGPLLDELGRKLDIFPTFDEQAHFGMTACLDKVYEYAKKHKNVMLLLNATAPITWS